MNIVSPRDNESYRNPERVRVPLRNFHIRPSFIPPVQHKHTGTVQSCLSFLYIVGVEGTSHHGITPAVAAIAKSCKYKVLYEDLQLRDAWSRNLPQSYRNVLEQYKQAVGKHIVIEDQSFPTDHVRRVSTPEGKKKTLTYNLEWIYDQTAAAGVDMKFLHLTRDFYRAVASHPELDNGFEPHAKVLFDFLQHIYSEYRLIDGRAPGRWREVQYESFTQMHNCTALVSALVEFMQWDHCDVDFACEMITSQVRTSSKNRTVNASDYAFAQAFDMDTSQPIPLLDIAPRDAYSFSTFVSKRKPFSFIV